MKKIRVAYIGDSPFLHTGFGNVANGIMSRWDMDRFEVHVLGTMHHYIPRDTAPYETYEPVPHNDPMGFRASVTFIQRVNPDVLFLIGDPGTLRNRFEGIKFAGMGKLMPTVTYFPIEGIPLNPHIIEQARFVVGPVTYTNWGADLLREKGIEVGVAPHGVDHADFRQYSREDKERLKAIVGWEGKTVIGTVGVNKRTNRQPSLIETARVIKDSGVENFVMYLHCQMRGEGFLGGGELDWMPKEFGGEDHIAFKPVQNEDRYFGRPNKAEVDVFSLPLPADKKEAEANLEKLGYIDILNQFDIYIDPAGAHGWNLPACEAARCGVPIIMVDDGFARHEIFSDVVHMLAPTASEYWHTGAVLPLVSPKKMADAIMKMIDSEDMRRVYGAAGKAKFDKYKWQPTADYFAEKVVAADKFGAEMMAKLANREVGKDVQDVEG